MKWFQIKEKSAGTKRLLLCWFLYRLLGKKIVQLIAYFVALITFITNKDLCFYTSKYFKILEEYTKNKKYKPSFSNGFKNTLAYAYSLVDKMEIFTNRYDATRIYFIDKNDEEVLFNDLAKGNGVFFICNHVGNVEALRVLINNSNIPIKPDISVFLQKKQCEIFNNFVNTISEKSNKIKTYPIEEIDLTTAFEIKDNLNKGEIVFMAGDRMPVNDTQKRLEVSILNKKVLIPQGAFKFARALESTVYFISCVENKNKYEIYLQKATDSKNITKTQEEFASFTNKMIEIAPYQFYNFYDFFDNTNE